MGDLTELQASQSVKIAGAPNTGVEDNFADVDSNNNLKVIPTNAGPVTPGVVATNSGLAGGQFNTTLPTLTNTQQSALQLDASGRLITSPGTDTDKFITGTLGALNATVTLATAGCGAGIFRIDGTWVREISLQVTIDGTNWIPNFFNNTGGTTAANKTQLNGEYRIIGIPAKAQVRLVMTSYVSGTATVSINASGPSNTTQNINYAPRYTGHYDDPGSHGDGTIQPFKLDQTGNLQTRSVVTTEEESFRDDFTGSSLTAVLTGTVNFVNGSNVVTGTGTLFFSELVKNQFIRKTSDTPDETTYFKVIDIIADNSLIIDAPYTGTTASVGATKSSWLDLAPPTGGSIVVANSILTINSGTSATGHSRIERDANRLPFNVSYFASISQRIANQTILLGFNPDADNPAQSEFDLIFDGTDNTKIKCVSGSSQLATDTETTIITLPAGVNTSQYLQYELDLTHHKATFLVGDKVVCVHETHIPGPFDQLEVAMDILNSGAVTNTALNVDYFSIADVDRLEIANSFLGEPQKVLLQGTSATSGLPIDLNLDSQGNLIVTALTGFGADFAFGDITTASQNKVVVNRTTYTEQTTNAQRSFASSSANDTAAGTGMQTLVLTYFDQTGAGPFMETVTLSGTTGVNTVNTNISFIENISAVTVGSTSSNVGIITLYAAINKGGAVVGTIAATDNQTFWTHHYVALGKTCNVTGLSCGHNGTTVGSGGVFILSRISINLANAVDLQVSDFVRLYGQSSTITRNYTSPIKILGPARLRAWVTPETSSSTRYMASFDFYES